MYLDEHCEKMRLMTNRPQVHVEADITKGLCTPYEDQKYATEEGWQSR